MLEVAMVTQTIFMLVVQTDLLFLFYFILLYSSATYTEHSIKNNIDIVIH